MCCITACFRSIGKNYCIPHDFTVHSYCQKELIANRILTPYVEHLKRMGKKVKYVYVAGTRAKSLK